MARRLTTTNLKYVSSNGLELKLNGETGYVVAPLDLGAITMGLTASQGHRRRGIVVRNKTMEAYPIVINGTILGETKDKRKYIHDVITPETTGRLIFDDRLFLEVEPTAMPNVRTNDYFAKFSFTVTVTNPCWQDVRSKLAVVSGSKAMFRMPVFSGGLHILAKRLTERSINALNEGNVSTPFKLTFVSHGEVENAELINVVTREFIRINKVFETGETITVDMTADPITITSSIHGDAHYLLDLESTPFMLEVGDNQLQELASDQVELLDIFVEHRDAYSGYR